MLHYALVFLVVAVIAAVLGVSGVAAVATNIAYVLFVVALVLFVVHLIIASAGTSSAIRIFCGVSYLMSLPSRILGVSGQEEDLVERQLPEDIVNRNYQRRDELLRAAEAELGKLGFAVGREIAPAADHVVVNA